MYNNVTPASFSIIKGSLMMEIHCFLAEKEEGWNEIRIEAQTGWENLNTDVH